MTTAQSTAAGRREIKFRELIKDNPGYRNLVLGRFTNFLGNGVAPIALSFAVLDRTGSASALSLVVGVRSLVNVAVLLFGGVLADRVSRSLLLQGSAIAAGASQAVLGGLLLVDRASLPVITTLAALNGAMAALSMPASSAALPQTVAKESLRRANTFSRLATNLALAIGASAGGALVGFLGSGAGIVIDAATFFLAALCFSRVRLTQPSPSAKEKPKFWRDVISGWREVTSRKWVGIIVLQALAWQVAWASSIQVLGPLVADATFGRKIWGIVLGLQTVGLIAGGIFAFRWKTFHRLAVAVGFSAIAALLPLALSFHWQWGVVAVAAFLCGFFLEQFGISWDVALQRNVPQDALARVYSLDSAGSMMAVPFGQVIAGPLSDAWGTQSILFSAGIIILLAAACAVLSPGVRRVQESDAVSDQAVPA